MVHIFYASFSVFVCFFCVCSNELEALAVDGGNDPKRKSVSWSDATDSNVQHQFMQRYVDLLWSHLENHLWDFLHENLWGGAVVIDKQSGSLNCVPYTTSLLLSRCMLQVCAKGDLFELLPFTKVHNGMWG